MHQHTKGMSKLFFYDTETTGLLHYKNAIHQISGLIVINNRITEEFNYQIKPHPEAVIEESALAVSNVTKEQIMEYPEPYIVHNKLLNLLAKYCNKFDKNDKFHLIGYNNRRFDDEFIRSFFNIRGDKFFGSWFWADSIDVLVLASNYLQDVRRELPDFKLRTVAEYLGIEVDETKLHDAIYDMHLTKAIYDIVGTNKIQKI
jgi:DNA polymerase III subunit epsilon